MEQVRAQSLPVRTGSLLDRLLFLVFILAAFALFAAPTLLPLLQRHARLLDEERALARDVERLQARSDHLVAFAASLTDDPGTNERLARQELNYKKTGESVVMIPPATPPLDDDPPPPLRADLSLAPPQWPPWSHEAERWAASHGLLDPLLDSSLQATWMLMSAGLVIAAFVLFPPRQRRIQGDVAAGAIA